MRFVSLSAIALTLIVAGCANQQVPPFASLERTSSGCARDGCKSTQWAVNAPLNSASQSLPAIDVDPVCQGIAKQGGVTFRDPEIPKTKKDCLDGEHLVRDKLMKDWESFDPSDRTHCTSESKLGGQSSYSELLTCLEMAQHVRELHREAVSNQPMRTVEQR